MSMGLDGGPGWGFSLGGFPVRVPLNTLIGVGIIAWLWLPLFGSSGGPGLLRALLFAVLLLASVLVHEFAHAAAARSFGYPVHGITLWAFGGFTAYRPVRDSAGRQAAVAAAGPAATLLVGAACAAAAQAASGPVGEVLSALALANLFMGVFNLLPGIPLDGGAILSAALWAVTGSKARGQVWGAYAGMGLAALVALYPFARAVGAGAPPSIIGVAVALLLAAFLFAGARAALRAARTAQRLAGATAADLAVPALVVPHSALVSDLDALLAGAGAGRPAVVLVRGPAGIRAAVEPQALASVPAEHRAATAVGSVAIPVGPFASVPAAAPAQQVLEDPALAPPLLVLDAGGAVVGLIPSPSAPGRRPLP